PAARLRRIHERDVDAELAEFFAEQPVHAAVDPLARQQVIARPQHGEMRERDRAHAAGDEQRRLRALEQRELFADVELVRVVAVAGVEDFGTRADRICEGGALVERGSDGRPVGARLGIAVNGAGVQSQSAAFHAAVSLMEPPPPGMRAASRRSTSSSSSAGAGSLAPSPSSTPSARSHSTANPAPVSTGSIASRCESVSPRSSSTFTLSRTSLATISSAQE